MSKFLNLLRQACLNPYDHENPISSFEREREHYLYRDILKYKLNRDCQNLTDEQACKLAVEKWRYFLIDIPDEFKTREMCLNVVKKSPHLLEYVPEKIKDADICQQAFKPSEYTGRFQAFPYIPEKFVTKEMCQQVSDSDFQYIPEKFKDRELCLKTPSSNFRYIPDKFKEELCFRAVGEFPQNLEFVPAHLKTEALCTVAVKQDGRTLCFVPEHLRKEELCIEAVKKNHFAFSSVPHDLKHKIHSLRQKHWSSCSDAEYWFKQKITGLCPWCENHLSKV